MGAPRPVTPLGIAEELLGSVLGRLDDTDDPATLRADLERARALVGGVEAYTAEVTSPASPALRELEARTRAHDWDDRGEHPQPGLEQEMLSGHVEGRFLAMLVHVMRARRVLDVGMFTGYSALAMAEALPPDGEVVACERDPATAALASECLGASPAGARVRVEVGPAADTLARLAGEGERFDLVFLDADKSGYADYLDAVLGDESSGPGLLAEGGLVCADNTLLQGEPWAAGPDASANGRAIADFNRRVADDPRLEQVLVPLRDGVTLVRRVDGPHP